VVRGDPYTEVSETAKIGTDEQELNRRLYNSGKVATHTNAQTYLRSTCAVDLAVIDRRIKVLPREVLN